MSVETEAIEELTRQIVNTIHPLRILLFGSAARGEWREDSDIDLLVVVPEGQHCRRVAQDLYRAIRNVPIPYDLVIATPSILQKFGSTPGLVYQHALKEGKELYAA